LGDFSKFAVEMLGGAPQNVERLVCADPLALHQNTFGLSNQFSRAQRSVKILGSSLFIFMEMSGRKCQGGQRRQNRRLASIDHAECARIASIKIDGASAGLIGQRKGENAPYSS
jgi:hypothetical protein